MLASLLGSVSAERVLVFILEKGHGYARQIAAFHSCDADSIQKQLAKFEHRGVLTSEWFGRTRVYRYNQRYPLIRELTALVRKARSFYPPQELDRLASAAIEPAASARQQHS